MEAVLFFLFCCHCTVCGLLELEDVAGAGAGAGEGEGEGEGAGAGAGAGAGWCRSRRPGGT